MWLRRYGRGQIFPRELEEWANLVEGREDIAYEQAAEDAVFRLANPEITGPIDDDLVEKLSASLKSGNQRK